MKWCVARYRIFFFWCAFSIGISPTYVNAQPLSPHLNHAESRETLPEIELSLEDLRLFVEVMQRIKGAYVDPVDDGALMRNAIKGMVEGLDSHSAYLAPKHMQQLREITLGKFAGIGVKVEIRKTFIEIIKPLPSSPASRVGIFPGDKITHLNGVPIKDLSPSSITENMRGSPGSKVALVLMRAGNKLPLHKTVTREIIHVRSVEHKYLEQGYGYIKINQFQRNTGNELVQSIAALEKKEVLQGLILDLRDNPGGVLQAAVDVADVFIRYGVIVSTKGRLVGSDLKFNANRVDLIQGLPLVVLINENSASASEIVAGALQDHHRAVIVGSQSYGKGSVQSILPLSSGYEPAGLKLTTARYYTPDGRSIQSKGIVPDIKVVVERQCKEAPCSDAQLLKAIGVVKSIDALSVAESTELLSEVDKP